MAGKAFVIQSLAEAEHNRLQGTVTAHIAATNKLAGVWHMGSFWEPQAFLAFKPKATGGYEGITWQMTTENKKKLDGSWSGFGECRHRKNPTYNKALSFKISNNEISFVIVNKVSGIKATLTPKRILIRGRWRDEEHSSPTNFSGSTTLTKEGALRLSGRLNDWRRCTFTLTRPTKRIIAEDSIRKLEVFKDPDSEYLVQLEDKSAPSKEAVTRAVPLKFDTKDSVIVQLEPGVSSTFVRRGGSTTYLRLPARYQAEYREALASSSKNLIWCVTSSSYNNKHVHQVKRAVCTSMAGKAFVIQSLAEAEHQRLDWIWCATKNRVSWRQRFSCIDALKGKAFANKALADAEHNRLQGTTTTELGLSWPRLSLGTAEAKTAQIATDLNKTSSPDQRSVELIQRALIDLGLYSGAIDGVAGPLTRTAIKQWAGMNNALDNEEITPALAEKIVADAESVKRQIALAEAKKKAAEEQKQKEEAARLAAEKKKKAEAEKQRQIALAKAEKKRQADLAAGRSHIRKELVKMRTLLENNLDYPQMAAAEKIVKTAISSLAQENLEVFDEAGGALEAAIRDVADYEQQKIEAERRRQIALAEAEKKAAEEQKQKEEAARLAAEKKKKEEAEKQRQIALAKAEAKAEKKRQAEQAAAAQAMTSADELPPLEPIDRILVVQQPINIREQPGVLAKKIGRVSSGETLTILAKVSGQDWYFVETDNGGRGYVFKRVLATDSGQQGEVSTTSKAMSKPAIEFGRYHALVIGNDTYRAFRDLRSAVNDARAVGALLESDYGFEVKVLTNATRSEIYSNLTDFRRKIGTKDNFLIYYAGHGWLDKEVDEGYWLPIDAQEEDASNWISSNEITAEIIRSKAKHVMVVADSCFSGTLTRGLTIKSRTPDYIKLMAKKKARTALTSGGLEPVMDSGGGSNHSVFAQAFLKILRENDTVLDGHQLFTVIRKKVMVGSEQTPEYGDIRKAGHDGGDFLFVRH